MASCSSFQEIFEKPLPENPTLIESLASSWKQQIRETKKQAELNSFTEIFGELHFKEINHHPESDPSLLIPSSSPSMDVNLLQPGIEKLINNNINNEKNKEEDTSLDSLLGTPKNQYTASAINGKKGFSPKKPESLNLCTEGLGFESSDEVENSKNQTGHDWKEYDGKEVSLENSSSGNLSNTKNPSSHHPGEVSIGKNSSSDNLNEFRRAKAQGRDFPPPLSCIGRNGKPRVCLKSYRYDGRFVLKEIEIPTMEVLHACREDGRLTLHLVIPDEEIPEEEEGEGEDLEQVEDEQEEENDDDADEPKENEKGGEENKYESKKDEVEGNQSLKV